MLYSPNSLWQSWQQETAAPTGIGVRLRVLFAIRCRIFKLRNKNKLKQTLSETYDIEHKRLPWSRPKYHEFYSAENHM
jgi:hypothetical protein